MKPQKILDHYNITWMRKKEEKKLAPYKDNDSVIGIIENALGVLFIIKSKLKYFGFYHNFWSEDYKQLYEIWESHLPKAARQIEREGVIIDKEEWTQFVMKMTTKAI